jgi:NIPSNAP
VLYRMRIYQAVPENLPAFHEFFRRWLLPLQRKHGARLVGRWETDDNRVVAVGEYDDRAAYQRIEAAVRQDPDLILAQQHRSLLPPLMTAREEVFMTDTLEAGAGLPGPGRSAGWSTVPGGDSRAEGGR